MIVGSICAIFLLAAVCSTTGSNRLDGDEIRRVRRISDRVRREQFHPFE